MSLCGNNNPCPDLITGQKCGITYTGARYVPLFSDPAQWDNTKTYEPLTIVLNEGNSYTSKTFVPVGVDISNEQYWALTGNYNAQVEAYRQEVEAVKKEIYGRAKYYNTISDILADQNLQANSYVRTGGYLFVNDSGDALYYVRTKNSSDIDNGGSIIFAGELVLELIFTDFVSAQCFGVKNEEYIVDNAKFLNFLNFLNSKDITGIIVGDFIFNTTVNLNGLSRMKLKGAKRGPNSGNSMIYNGTGYLFTHDDSKTNCKIVVDGINFTGNGSNNCFDINFCAFSDFKNIIFLTFKTVLNLNNCWSSSYYQLRFVNCDTGFVTCEKTKDITPAATCDMSDFSNIYFSGRITNAFRCYKLRSSKFKFINFESVTATNPMFNLIECADLLFEELYSENFKQSSLIYLNTEHEGQSYDQWNSNIRIVSSRFYGGGTFVFCEPYVSDLTVENIGITQDNNPVPSPLVQFRNITDDTRALKFRNININSVYQPNVPEINKNGYFSSGNLKYGGIFLKEGDLVKDSQTTVLSVCTKRGLYSSTLIVSSDYTAVSTVLTLTTPLTVLPFTPVVISNSIYYVMKVDGNTLTLNTAPPTSGSVQIPAATLIAV